VDIGSFSDVAEEVQKEVVSTAATEAPAAAMDTAVPQSAHPQEEVSPEFTRDLDLTIHKGEEPIQDVSLLETREDLPEGQDPSPYVAAFNKSFGTSYRGELLSVGCEVARNKGGAPSNMACILCQSHAVEDRNHLFFECPFATVCWNKLHITWEDVPEVHERLLRANSVFHHSFFMDIFIMGAWELWKMRNAVIFDAAPPLFSTWTVKFRELVRLQIIRFKEAHRVFLSSWLLSVV
jgi:hypothetical protein